MRGSRVWQVLNIKWVPACAGMTLQSNNRLHWFCHKEIQFVK
jgi:hypothetical protein